MKTRFPTQKIIIALFESYLNSRRKDWGIPEGGPFLPADPTAQSKTNMSVELLAALPDNNDQEKWKETAYHFAEKYRQEHDRYTLGLRFGLIPIEVVWSRRHEDTIFAGLTCLLKKQNITSEILTKEKDGLEAEVIADRKDKKDKEIINQKLLKIKNINTCLEVFIKGRDKKDKTDYPYQYFLEVTVKCDQQAALLNEHSFDDFQENVMNGTRTLNTCEGLLFQKQNSAPKKLEEPVATPVTTSVYSAQSSTLYRDKAADTSSKSTDTSAPISSRRKKHKEEEARPSMEESSYHRHKYGTRSHR